jgi:hypothetical protein
MSCPEIEIQIELLKLVMRQTELSFGNLELSAEEKKDALELISDEIAKLFEKFEEIKER